MGNWDLHPDAECIWAGYLHVKAHSLPVVTIQHCRLSFVLVLGGPAEQQVHGPEAGSAPNSCTMQWQGQRSPAPRHPQPFIMGNEKCSMEKINGFADAAKTNGDVQEEHRAVARRQVPHTVVAIGQVFQVVLQSGSDALLFSPYALNVLTYEKQDMITNGKHNVWQVISLVKT